MSPTIHAAQPTDRTRPLTIVTESYSFGGLETHIDSEVRTLARLGYAIHLLLGSVSKSLPEPSYLGSASIGLPISADMRVAHLLESVEAIRNHIDSFGPVLLHVHPYLSIIPTLFAVALKPLPLAITIHGPNTVLNQYTGLYHELLRHYVLNPAITTCVVSEEVQDIVQALYPQARPLVLPNPISPPTDSEQRVIPTIDRVLFLTRIDEYKLPGLLDFVQKAKAANLPPIDICGDGPAKEQLKSLLRQSGLESHACIRPWTPTPRTEILQYRAVAGMGRTVIESCALRRPTILVGYDGVKGVVAPELIARASYANYSGRRLPTVDAATLRQQLLTTSEEQIQDCQHLILQKHAEQTVWTLFINAATATIPHNLEPVIDTYRKIKTSRSILGCALLSRELDIELGITTGSSSDSPLERAAVRHSESQTESSHETCHAINKAPSGPPASIDKARLHEIASTRGTASALETPSSAGNNPIRPYLALLRNAFRKLGQYSQSFLEVVREQGIRRALIESYLFLLAALFPARAILWRGSYSGDEYDSLYALARSHVDTLLSCTPPTETESTIRTAIAILLSGYTECRLVAFSDLESLSFQSQMIEEVSKRNDSKPLIFLRIAFGQPYCLRLSHNAIETNAILPVLSSLANIEVELVSFTPLIEPLLPSLRVCRFSYDTRLLRTNGLANSGLALASHARLAKFAEALFQIHRRQTEGRAAWQADRDLLNGMKPVPLLLSDANTLRQTDGFHADPEAIFAVACCEPLDERLDWAQFLRLPEEVRRGGVLFVGRCSLTLPIGPESAAPDAVKRSFIASENASVFPTFVSTLSCWLKLCRTVVSHPESPSFLPGLEQGQGANYAHQDKKIRLDRQLSETSLIGPRGARCLAIIQNVTFFDWTGQRFLNGGAERYVLDLADILSQEGFEVILAQGATRSFEKRHGDYVVTGIPVGSQNVFRELSRKANEFFKDAGLFIASPLELAMCIRDIPTIGINHGIHWDHKRNSARNYEIQRFENVLAALNRCTTIIAVDTNFINWLRTVDYEHAQRVAFVPNYVDLSRFIYTEKNFEGPLVCLFPRRLYEARGLQITARAFDRLLLTFGDLSLHFVGQADSDPDLEIVMELQRRHGARILWEERPSNEMPDVYMKAHVAVIPTMYSEGTSLSCLEAMASNCCVIVTDVGGLPNLIFNGYNGFVIKPKASDLFAVMELIYRNRRLASDTARRGREVATAFDKHNWEKRWRAIIRQVTG